MGLFDFLGEEFSKKRAKEREGVLGKFIIMCGRLHRARPDSAMMSGLVRYDGDKQGWTVYVAGRNAPVGEISGEEYKETMVFLPDFAEFDRKSRRVDCKTIDELVVQYEEAVKKKWIIRGCDQLERLEIGISVMNADETVIYSIKCRNADDLFRYLANRGDCSICQK